MNNGTMNELEEEWAVIYKAILELRSRLEKGDFTPVSIEEHMHVYRIVYKISRKNSEHDQQLYDRYRDSFKEYINSVVLPALREQSDDLLFVGELLRRWKIHKAILHWDSFFLGYLERSYRSTIEEVGTICFRDLVISKMRTNFKNAVIALIHQEREGEHIDGAMLKDVVGIFVEMDFYTNDFEVEMLEQTGAYYSRKAASWVLEDCYTDYRLRVEECLIREKDRVDRYLHPSSLQKVLDKVENVLLYCYITHFVEDDHSGCLALLRSHRNDDLLIMHGLFNRIPNSWELIANAFKRYVISEVTPLVKEAGDALKHKAEKRDKSLLVQEVAAFVGKVIGLRDQHMKYAVDVFQHNSIFLRALKEAFQVSCKEVIPGNTSAEWLATLCDSLHKNDSRNKMLRRDEIIENVVEIVEYISDKYMFAEFYRQKLSHRLLFNKSANVDLEESILSMLTGKCDGQLTSKMRGMLTDLKRSQETQSKFETYLNNNNNNRNIHPGIEFTVTVLTTVFWPTFKSSQLIVPSEMVRCVEVFQEFYSTETQHKQLNWIYSMGTCNIIGRFDGGPIEIMATPYQTAILLLFNDYEKLSYSDIRTLLNLEEEEVDRLLYSLACAKYKILLKKPNTITVATADDFEVNSKFTSRTGKVKFPMAILEEKTKVSEDTYQNRGFVIDACIMRIMKAQRVFSFKQLMSECGKQLGPWISNIDLKELKIRVEWLMERDYLERDKENPDILRYMP